MYSREDTVQWLLARKSNPNSVGGPMMQTVLHLASARQSGQSVQIVKILLLHCNKDLRLKEDSCGSIPLFCAIESGNNNVCRELLAVNPEQQVSISNLVTFLQTKHCLGDASKATSWRYGNASCCKEKR